MCVRSSHNTPPLAIIIAKNFRGPAAFFARLLRERPARWVYTTSATSTNFLRHRPPARSPFLSAGPHRLRKNACKGPASRAPDQGNPSRCQTAAASGFSHSSTMAVTIQSAVIHRTSSSPGRDSTAIVPGTEGASHSLRESRAERSPICMSYISAPRRSDHEFSQAAGPPLPHDKCS